MNTLFNVQAPAIITNTFTMGASYQLTDNIICSLAWMHAFRDAIEGPIVRPPGSSVRLDAQLGALWVGFNQVKTPVAMGIPAKDHYVESAF